MSEILVSIIMPAYNASSVIQASISSVMNQTYSNWELLVIDDCSSDGTREIVQKIDDARVRYYSTAVNSGSPATPRNIGVDKSSGHYIAFLDSDDTWHSNKLEFQLGEMLEKKLDFTCSGYNILKGGNKIRSFIPSVKSSYEDLLINNQVGCLTAIVKRSLLAELRFPQCGHEDYALWLKILKKTNYVYGFNNVLADYNLVEGSVSSNKLKVIPFFWNIYRNEEGMSFVNSIRCCFFYFVNVILFKYKR
ncbi:hypothetical protein BCT10_16565 [Vibrio splendidus]|uniref:glycosyltransferase family 2 protein n=1 Tax=Vibrio splendidus TaxID=29497 RepID=UPI000C854E45|nr:glycosyltransferase family 2 protein [Vibrio splendidus]PMO42759.1 hypothetical protein BCT10_16565 [Vibrio splendidus]